MKIEEFKALPNGTLSRPSRHPESDRAAHSCRPPETIR